MDERTVLSLLDKFRESGLAEMDYTDGGSRLLLRSHGRPIAASGIQAEAAGARNGGGTRVDATGGGTDVSGTGIEGTGVEVVKSPIVGVFYASSEPDAPPFVRAGETVKAGAILCAIEAMKMMNKLEAEFDCEILAVKAASGDMVEYGQPLFEVRRLRPSGGA